MGGCMAIKTAIAKGSTVEKLRPLGLNVKLQQARALIGPRGPACRTLVGDGCLA